MNYHNCTFIFAAVLFITGFSFSACRKDVIMEEDADEFFSLRVGNATHTWLSPYRLYAKEDTNTHGSSYYHNLIGAYDTIRRSHSVDLILLHPANRQDSLPCKFDIQSIAVYDPAATSGMQGNFFPLNVSRADITEFDPIGKYIAGSFSGMYIRSTITVPADTVMMIGSWRIKREPF